MINTSLLTRCSNAHAVSGFESEIRHLVRAELASCCQLQSYPSGNLLATLPDACCVGGESAPRVMFDAHMDEVGFMVQSVTADGFLRFVPLGGWWNHSLPSQRVIVRALDGSKHLGVIGTKAPHLIPASQRNQVMATEDLFVDMGASSAQEIASLGIEAGCVITPDASMSPLSVPHRWMGKAFDNRVGVYTLIEVLKQLAAEAASDPLPCRVSAIATVQEELGLRGAKAIAPSIIPDVMIVLEGPPADDTLGMPASGRTGELGKGVQVRLYDPTHITHPALAALVREVAAAENIPVQWAVRHSGGTDAGATYSNWQGIASIVLGVPVRYLHSHQGIVDERDIAAMQALSCALARALTAERLAELLELS